MRDWYTKHLEKRGGSKSKVKAIYIILGFNVFLIFSIVKTKNHSVPLAEPNLISQKLTTDLASKRLEDRLFIVEHGGTINYLIEYELYNSGSDGFVILEAELIREDTTIQAGEIIEIKSEETVNKILKFPALDYKALKRDYSFNVEAVIVEDVLSSK